MDPIQFPPQPTDFKDKVTETSRELIKDHYEGFFRSSINLMLSLLNMLKSSTIQVIRQLINKE